MIVYIAYPTSLMLQSANALQTYTTLRELRARRPDTRAFIPRWGHEASRFEEVGACHLPRPAIGKLSRLYKSTLLYYLEHSAFALMTALRLAPQARQIEAVYVRQVICAAWWAGVYGPLLGVPVIYEAHDLEARNPSRAKERWAEGLLHLIDRVALTRSAAVVSLTEDFRRLVSQIGWRRAEEVYVVPDAYDQTLFAPQDRAVCRAALGLPAHAPLIAYAGMTFAHRWLDGLVAAVQNLVAQHPDLVLVLVGGREAERAALRQQAAGLGWTIWEGEGELVAHAGCPTLGILAPRPQSEVLTVLGAADVLAIPDTVTDVTASPLKLFEYMALGQPIVLPEMPALAEIIPPSLSHTFPRRDLNGLTAALAAALGASGDQEANAARRVLAADHTYARRAERIIAVVQAVGRRR
ncbi:glycosyl transferase group 1 [Oscillochloris trichoides DG-6]|uniref:Glycosyl transferase group 1 n=1 Tax=Oscillochloris trichoides DG-6 TaxID=765420 RepID=E1IG89_9CHLR|nr:glycosyltransferase [Oscillochloris trichoides]EFO79823.1 glycosyl transferase group 1 [Oscillochloris trichoides DG-6]